MKNFKKIAVALSLTAAIGIGSLAYASDFSATEEPNETFESTGGHCFERGNTGRRHNGMRHNRNHRGRRNHKMRHNEHNGMQHRR